ncbi:MAG: polysaccharide deacetylase family protein [Veillonellaceae bacterium]|nr:polysaccharide deacetylase family protein [Veillonellaceae bacterium]
MNPKHTCLRLLGSAQIGSLLRRALLRRKIVILMYHEVLEDDKELEAWTVLRSSDFLWQMEFLRRHFQVISLDAALHLLEEGMSWNGRPRAVVTFDDGYAGNARCALPIIEALEIPVTVFVATEAVEIGGLYWYDRVILALQHAETDLGIDLGAFGLGVYCLPSGVTGECRWTGIQSLLSALKTLLPHHRANAIDCIFRTTGEHGNRLTGLLSPMSIEDVRLISQSPLVTIGAHSHCHNLLVQLGDKEALESIERSKELLERWTGRPVGFFAYPNGDFNARVIKSVAHAGFECGLTTVDRPASARDNCFTLPRIGIGRYDTQELFSAKLSGIRVPW